MERLRALRKAHGLTQQQMADLLGIDRTTYTKYERGQSEPNLAALRLIARQFSVTIDYLIGDTDSPTASAPLESYTAIGDPTFDLDLARLTPKQRESLHEFARFLLAQEEE